MKSVKFIIPLLLTAAVMLGATGCPTQNFFDPSNDSSDWGSDVLTSVSTTPPVDEKSDEEIFTDNMADFAVKLFQKSVSDKQNSMISPLSVMLALAMTANGADGKTLAQMETLLGGGIPLDQLNEYLYGYAKNLPNESKAKLGIANSIWFRDSNYVKVYPEFLQKNADYYGAEVFETLSNPQAVRDINNWAKEKTDGMIDNIIEKIDGDSMMYLINAVVFDAEWQRGYKTYEIKNDNFTNINGKTKITEFMNSSEYRYIEDGRAIGFIKPYAGGGYSFAALLPNKDIPIGEYINSLTGAGLVHTLRNAQNIEVIATMPKFKYKYSVEMKTALSALGIPDAFSASRADFSKMGTALQGPILIHDVLHKTFIAVDELGTRAGAITAVATTVSGIMPEKPKPKIVKLNRPFVFAIIENATNLPIFIGTLMDVS